MKKMSRLPDNVREEIHKLSEVASYLWDKQWAERNAGNISVRLTDFFGENDFSDIPAFTPCQQLPEMSAGQIYLVTGAGCYLRDLVKNPEKASAILLINQHANAYAVLWGGEKDGFRPTSEFVSHIRIHCYCQENNPKHNAVLHTHCTELIVMSHHPLFHDEDEFNRSIWKMCPEARVYLPKGICCAPYALTGTAELAERSIAGLKKRDVVLWEKHGPLATGEDVIRAFDYLDVANKAAKMLLMAWSAGFEPAGLTEEQIRELEKKFLSK